MPHCSVDATCSRTVQAREEDRVVVQAGCPKAVDAPSALGPVPLCGAKLPDLDELHPEVVGSHTGDAAIPHVHDTQTSQRRELRHEATVLEDEPALLVLIRQGKGSRPDPTVAIHEKLAKSRIVLGEWHELAKTLECIPTWAVRLTHLLLPERFHSAGRDLSRCEGQSYGALELTVPAVAMDQGTWSEGVAEPDRGPDQLSPLRKRGGERHLTITCPTHHPLIMWEPTDGIDEMTFQVVVRHEGCVYNQAFSG